MFTYLIFFETHFAQVEISTFYSIQEQRKTATQRCLRQTSSKKRRNHQKEIPGTTKSHRPNGPGLSGTPKTR